VRLALLALPVLIAVALPSTASAATNPLSAVKLYVTPGTAAAAAASHATDPRDAVALRSIAQTPTAVWIGDWDAATAVSARVDRVLTDAGRTHRVPVLVLYAVPHRDCGSNSRGGSPSAASYQVWFNKALAGVKGRRAIVVLEPDALPQLDCLPAADRAARVQLLSWAVGQLALRRSVTSYIDAGNANWQPTKIIASRLRAVGAQRLRGFSLNVSGFQSTAASTSYGEKVSALAGGAHFVIDTSRNGRATATTWCNPKGQRLGTRPTVTTRNPLVDAYLWVKHPGESDGTCGGGPAAGRFWVSYALALAGRR
jgi:endoglucanase